MNSSFVDALTTVSPPSSGRANSRKPPPFEERLSRWLKKQRLLQAYLGPWFQVYRADSFRAPKTMQRNGADSAPVLPDQLRAHALWRLLEQVPQSDCCGCLLRWRVVHVGASVFDALTLVAQKSLRNEP